MFDYFLYRWVISRRFEKVDSGYVYRRRPDLPGIELNEEERLATLREFRRRYFRSWLMMFGGFLAAVVALALVSVAFSLNENFVMVAGYALVVVFVAVILKEQREWFLLPEKRFEDRPRVASSLPTGGWFFRYQTLSRRRSWSAHAALIVLYGTIGWLLTPRSLDASVGHWFLFGCFAMSLMLLVYGASLKIRAPTTR